MAEKVLARLKAPLDRARLAQLRISIFTGMHDYPAALDIGLSEIERLGIGLIEGVPEDFDAGAINGLPPMTDPAKLAAAKIMAALIDCAAASNPKMHRTLGLLHGGAKRQIRRCRLFGLCVWPHCSLSCAGRRHREGLPAWEGRPGAVQPVERPGDEEPGCERVRQLHRALERAIGRGRQGYAARHRGCAGLRRYRRRLLLRRALLQHLVLLGNLPRCGGNCRARFSQDGARFKAAAGGPLLERHASGRASPQATAGQNEIARRRMRRGKRLYTAGRAKPCASVLALLYENGYGLLIRARPGSRGLRPEAMPYAASPACSLPLVARELGKFLTNSSGTLKPAPPSQPAHRRSDHGQPGGER